MLSSIQDFQKESLPSREPNNNDILNTNNEASSVKIDVEALKERDSESSLKSVRKMTFEEYKNNYSISKDYSFADTKLTFKKRIYLTIRRNACLFPLLFSLWVIPMCLIPYVTAVLHGHLNPIFPYVSDTGALTPQAGIFSMMMDIAAILMFISGIFRYKMIKFELNNYVESSIKITNLQSIRSVKRSHYHSWNFIGLTLITASAFGTVAVGNFRVTEWIILHFIGAAMCFLPMLAYYFIQLYLTNYLYKQKIETRPGTMFIIVLVGMIGLMSFIGFSLVSIFISGLSNVIDDDWRLHWSADKPAYIWHCLGTAGEWLAIYSLTPFFFSLYNRMKMFQHFDKV